MDILKFLNVVKKYKKCPSCGGSWKSTKLKTFLEHNVITIYCECGFLKKVDENNQELKRKELYDGN